MRRKSSLLCICGILLLCRSVAADTSRILSREAFINAVLAYHPVVKQAELITERADWETLKARGAFDPVVKSDLDTKTFDGTRYYRYQQNQLVIPTWYGIELKAGLENVNGERVTEEATLGKTSYAGINVPVHGLLFDQRRAALRQARQFALLTRAEQRLAVNDLLYDALNAYWSWVQEYRLLQVVTEAVRINQLRIGFIKSEYELGARPGIDTIEAISQWQNMLLQQSQYQVSVQNAGISLSGFLWLPDGQPAGWSDRVVPDSLDLKAAILKELPPPVETLVQQALQQHPKLDAINSKMSILETDIRLKAQYLLPKMNLTANLLNKGYTVPDKWSAPYLENNHKLGISLSMPLFLREARGAYRSSRLKLRETEWTRSQERREVENKVRMYYNDLQNLQQQITLYQEIYTNTERLYLGERTRLEVGESTLFLLNTRENKLLEQAQKLQEALVKWQKYLVKLRWATGAVL